MRPLPVLSFVTTCHKTLTLPRCRDSITRKCGWFCLPPWRECPHAKCASAKDRRRSDKNKKKQINRQRKDTAEGSVSRTMTQRQLMSGVNSGPWPGGVLGVALATVASWKESSVYQWPRAVVALMEPSLDAEQGCV